MPNDSVALWIIAGSLFAYCVVRPVWKGLIAVWLTRHPYDARDTALGQFFAWALRK